MGNIRCKKSLPIIEDKFHANVCHSKRTVRHTVASEIVFAKSAKNSMEWLGEGAKRPSIEREARDKAEGGVWRGDSENF